MSITLPKKKIMKYHYSSRIKGCVYLNVNQKNGQNEIVFYRCTCPLSILLLLAAIGAKLIGPQGGLQVDKPNVGKVTGSVDAHYR